MVAPLQCENSSLSYCRYIFLDIMQWRSICHLAVYRHLAKMERQNLLIETYLNLNRFIFISPRRQFIDLNFHSFVWREKHACTTHAYRIRINLSFKNVLSSLGFFPIVRNSETSGYFRYSIVVVLHEVSNNVTKSLASYRAKQFCEFPKFIWSNKL